MMFLATARLSSLPRLGLRLPLRAVQAHTYSHTATATATVSGVRVRATREREVVEALGRVQEPLSCQSLHHIAAIQVLSLPHTASHCITLHHTSTATPPHSTSQHSPLHCTALTIHTFCTPIHSIFDSYTFLRVGATSACQFSLLIC